MNIQITFDINAKAVPHEAALRRMLDTIGDAFAEPATYTYQVWQTRRGEELRRAQQERTPWLKVQLTY